MHLGVGTVRYVSVNVAFRTVHRTDNVDVVRIIGWFAIATAHLP
ncbi:MAG: hypothetical protein ACRDOL_25680 [Streptosporangiaceae bacterium]